MSLFRTVSAYALQTAICRDEEIDADRIWSEAVFNGKKVLIPKFCRDGSFADKKINQQYLKTLERDLYQAIMRGCIREHSDAEYHVIALVNIPQVVNLLKLDLPECHIHFLENEVLNLHFQGNSQRSNSQSIRILPLGLIFSIKKEWFTLRISIGIPLFSLMFVYPPVQADKNSSNYADSKISAKLSFIHSS